MNLKCLQGISDPIRSGSQPLSLCYHLLFTFTLPSHSFVVLFLLNFSEISSTCRATGEMDECLTVYTTGQVVGMTLDAEAGLVSLLAVIILLLCVMKNVVRNIQYPPPGGNPFLRTHIDIYFLNLLTFDFLHGLASTMGVKWLHEGQIRCGTYCNVQGAIRNVGSTGVALMILTIAVHTFLVIFFQWIPPKSLYIPIAVIGFIWGLLIAYISYQLAQPRMPGHEYFTPSPYWCWIGSKYPTARIWGQYLWLWLSAFISIILYVPLYLCVRGNLSYDPYAKWKLQFSYKPVLRDVFNTSSTQAARVATMDAMCMLYYPVAYILLVFPVSLFRFLGQSWEAKGKELPFAASVSGAAILGLSGVVNVTLFIYTRPNLLLFRNTPSLTPRERITMIHRRTQPPLDPAATMWLPYPSYRNASRPPTVRHSVVDSSRDGPSPPSPPRPARPPLRVASGYDNIIHARRPPTR